MSSTNRIMSSNGDAIYFKDVKSYYKKGTVTNINAGAGLTATRFGEDNDEIEINYKLKSAAVGSLLGTRTTVSNREYALGVDKNGYLSVNVPWVDTTYSAGDHISISSSKQISVTGIGAITKTDGSNTTIANLTAKNLASVVLSKGVYFIIGTAIFSGNSNGFRELRISSTSAGSGTTVFNTKRVKTLDQNADSLHFQITGYFSIGTDNTTIYLVGYQNSGATLNITYPGIQCIKIK